MTNHRATYCYEPQRAILIIALQKISRFVFNGVPSKKVQFHQIAFLLYHKYYNFSSVSIKKRSYGLLCFSHTYILLLQKNAFFEKSLFISRKEVSRRKGVESTTSNRKSVFLFSTMSLFLVRHPKAKEKTPQVRAVAIQIWFLSISALQHNEKDDHHTMIVMSGI